MKKKWIAIAALAAMSIHLESAVANEDTGCYAEDGSYIENCDSYYSTPTYDEQDAYLVMVWTKGTTDNCGYRTNSYSEANSIAQQWQETGYAAAVVHSTPSLESKMPYCS